MNKIKIFSGMVLMFVLFLIPVSAQDQGTDTTGQATDAPAAQTTDAGDTDTLSQKSVEDLRKDLAEVNKQYGALRKEALKDIAISELSDKWNKKLESVMIEKDSTAKAKFAERDKISADFETARKANDKDEMRKQQEAYRDVMLDIQKIQQKVLEDDSLRAEYKSVEDAIMNKMVEINPEAPELKQKIEDISVAIQSKNQE
jgi:hypothetical protein